ncbi:MAG: hypothetical protein WBC04_08035 [Candidatus Acidiferrales bacterium]
MRARPPKEVAPAPLPAQIITARKVFISNAGEDPHFKRLGLRRPYNQFYAAMKDWGRYELATSPAEADVVLEIRLASQIEKYGKELLIVPLLRLGVLDPKTRTILWAFTEELETGGIVGLHEDAKFDRAMDKIVEDLKSLVAQPPSPPTPAKP